MYLSSTLVCSVIRVDAIENNTIPWMCSGCLIGDGGLIDGMGGLMKERLEREEGEEKAVSKRRLKTLMVSNSYSKHNTL